MEEVFTDIYKKKKWWNGSGQGSEPLNVATYCEFLQNFLHVNKIKKVLDMGCGDWKFSRLIDWTGIEYIGIDIVPSIIEANKKQFETPHIQFVVFDGTNDSLPKADLIIVKDVLQHWPNNDVTGFEQTLRSYPHNLIINTIEEYNVSDRANKISTTGKVNRDIHLGEGRPLDLSLSPFNWHILELFRYSYVVEHWKRQDVKSVATLLK